MPESIVGCQKEPCVATTLYDLLRCSDRERASIEYPLHGIWRTEFAVKIACAGRMRDHHLLLFFSDILDSQAYGGNRYIHDQIDLFHVVPTSGYRRPDIGFDLVVARNHHDPLAQNLPAKITLGVAMTPDDAWCPTIVWISSINKAGSTVGEKSFDLTGRFGDYVVRLAGPQLALQFNKRVIRGVEPVCQHP